MLAVIELGASQRSPSPPPIDLVEEMFFGKKLDVESLHPQVQDIYSDAFKQLDEMDKVCRLRFHFLLQLTPSPDPG
jgi:hypothetical protein